jgi:hypothetical protein
MVVTEPLVRDVDARVLRSDGTGVFWLTTDGRLVSLPDGASMPTTLVSDPRLRIDVDAGASMVLTDSYALWSIRRIHAPTLIHRTRKDGHTDQIQELPGACRLLTTGGHLVYLLMSRADDGACAALATAADDAFPLTATVRMTLARPFDIRDLISDDGSLYWVQSYAYGSTVYYSSLRTMPIKDLFGRRRPHDTVVSDLSSAVSVGSTGVALLVGTVQGLELVPKPADGGGRRAVVAHLGGAPSSFVEVGQGFVTSYLCNSERVLASVGAPPARDVHIIAAGLKSDVVLSKRGLVFVDSASRLVSIALGALP